MVIVLVAQKVQVATAINQHFEAFGLCCADVAPLRWGECHDMKSNIPCDECKCPNFERGGE